ncbi:uncharacterized protein RCC_07998 [Ramularia collo-cygni]|uniref:Uncharacterized protein n=1 Tax=Ramularia collo-cygni TaxID=112498 RepID=A0A2D3VJ84_9PEZI|nr:uncharacterized protein RCC_07998 [Ramularia collo-cygni]CZT22129.1 uncharacterized protein RCC_07998 [Ramularia collo-cygni]
MLNDADLTTPAHIWAMVLEDGPPDAVPKMTFQEPLCQRQVYEGHDPPTTTRRQAMPTTTSHGLDAEWLWMVLLGGATKPDIKLGTRWTKRTGGPVAATMCLSTHMN